MNKKLKETVVSTRAIWSEIGEFVFYVMLLVYLGLVTYDEIFSSNISGLLNLDFVFLMVAIMFGIYMLTKIDIVSNKKEVTRTKTRFEKILSYLVPLLIVIFFLVTMAIKTAVFGVYSYVVIATFALLFIVVIIFMLNE